MIQVYCEPTDIKNTCTQDNICAYLCTYVPFAVSSSMFTHTEIVEQQSIA